MKRSSRAISRAALATVLLTGTATTLGADTVHTKDGSVLNGTIAAIEEDKLELETSYAGTVIVDIDEVTSVRSDESYATTLASGNTLVGQFAREGDKTVIETELGAIDISEDRIVAAVPEGQAPPPATAATGSAVGQTKEADWTYEGTVDVGGKTGNTERFTTAVSLSATRSTDAETVRLYASAEKTEEDGDTTADELLGGIDFEHLLSRKHSWYTRVELGRDDIEDVELRTIAALGYGYYFLRQDDHRIRGRVGSLFRHESYENDASEESVGLDLSLHNDWALTKALRMVNDLTYTPSIEDSSDYRLTHTSSLETPLQLVDGDVRLRLGMTNEYDGQPVEGIEKLDTSYLMRLVFGW